MSSSGIPFEESYKMPDLDTPEAGVRAPAWQRRKEYREKEILNAAVELLVEVGVNDLSMIEIARRAGVSEATVYKYFENRQEIVARAMQEALSPSISALERDIEFIPGCEARLRFFIARSLQDMALRPNVHRATHGQLRWTGEHKTILRDVHRRFARLVAAIFEEGVRTGELKPDANFVLAGDMLFGGIESLGWRTLLAGRPMDVGIDEFAAGFADQLLGGVRIGQGAAVSLVDRLEELVERIERTVPG